LQLISVAVAAVAKTTISAKWRQLSTDWGGFIVACRSFLVPLAGYETVDNQMFFKHDMGGT